MLCQNSLCLFYIGLCQSSLFTVVYKSSVGDSVEHQPKMYNSHTA
uniref:Uncharacterized protein n=1 Tax=Arundo donax TaxID=35708 RepID=A0A0A9H9R1_ARUDO